MITLAQAQQQIIQSITPIVETERVELSSALGRVCAQDIVSSVAVPPTDNSAMDGFALNAADVHDVPAQLRVSQRIPAGVQAQPLELNTAARIFTGGVMPAGADAVVIQENCSFEADADSVQINTVVNSGDNVRPCGQDINLHATVIRKAEKLNAARLGLIASIGLAQVEVYRALKVAIFSTGDELAEPGQKLKDGQIYNSNRTTLSALCRQLGYQVVDCGIVQDTLQATKQALSEAANLADVVISSGGVSVGEEDHVKPAVEALGSLDLWKVQMKPGKPLAFGQISGTPFLGLPGNPVSSFVVFQLLAIPLLATRQGQAWQAPHQYSVIAGFSKKTTDREEYIRVQLVADQNGQPRAERFQNLSSGVMTSLSWADGLVRQPINHVISAGQSVGYLPLKEAML